MKSFDFTADRHKLIAHRGIHQPQPAPANPHKRHKPDLLDRLISQHPLLHRIELLLPSDEPSLPPLPPAPVSYHVAARLTAFLSAPFLLPLLASGSLAAFTLSTPIDRCNTFTLLSTPNTSHATTPARATTATATVALTLDQDTYQQLGLTGQPLAAQPGFHVVSITIQASKWQPSCRLYQRVQTCLAAMAEVELLVQHIDSGGLCGGEALFTAEGIRVIKRVDNDEQRWQTDHPVAVPDVSAVWLAGCDDADKPAMLRQQRKDAQQQIDQLDIELLDWIGLTTNHLTDLLPTHTTTPDPTNQPPSTALVDHPFCTSLPLLPAATASLIAAVRYTGLLSHGGVWRSLLAHGWQLVGGGAGGAVVPWVCLVVSGMVDAGNGVGVDGYGNGEDDWCVMLLPGRRYLLYQMANACMPVH